MTGRQMIHTMNTIAPMHGTDIMYWYRSGLYCRTQISDLPFCI